MSSLNLPAGAPATSRSPVAELLSGSLHDYLLSTSDPDELADALAADLEKAGLLAPQHDPLQSRWVPLNESLPPAGRIVRVALTEPPHHRQFHRVPAELLHGKWICHAPGMVGQELDGYTIHYWLYVPQVLMAPEVSTLSIPTPPHAT